MNSSKKPRVGIFDSGAGGHAFARSLNAMLPEIEYIVVDDRTNVPYGDKDPDEIIRLTQKAIHPLIEKSCDVIIIACNSATAAALSHLRSVYPRQLFIGVEPMLKPASALTKSSIIGVCATPATLKSERYLALKSLWAQGLTVLEPDCSEWARMIETNAVEEGKITHAITNMRMRGVDVIILGCTHYSIIRPLIERLAGSSISVIDPTEALIKRLRSVLQLG
jgi:glutamate racemase